MDAIDVKQMNEDKSLACMDQNIRLVTKDEILSATSLSDSCCACPNCHLYEGEVSDIRYTNCGMFAVAKSCGWILILSRASGGL